MTPGKIYRRPHRHGQIKSYTMCRVLRRTEDGWLIDCGNGRREEITEAEAFEIMNSYAHVELPEMKPVKDFPMN